jgi:hypothetical protein
LALESGYNDTALLQIYHDGLNDSIKDSLAQAIEVPDKLEEYALLCIKIDNRQYSRRMEKTPSYFPSQAAVPNSGPEPMQVDTIQLPPKAPLTSAEREKRSKMGLCFYCGTSGHMAKSCPKKSGHLNSKVQAQ